MDQVALVQAEEDRSLPARRSCGGPGDVWNRPVASRPRTVGAEAGVRRLPLSIALALVLVAYMSIAAGASTSVGCDPNPTTRANALIAAIANAVTAGGTQTVALASACTYTLTTVNNGSGVNTNGLPRINNNVDLTVTGNNATITRDGAASRFRLFQVDSGATLRLNDITLSGGHTPDGAPSQNGGDGGAIYNAGTLHVADSVVQQNKTGDGGDGQDGPPTLGAGNGGQGGGLFNSGTTQITRTRVSGNMTGMGGTMISDGDGGHGGGVSNSGTLRVTRSLFSSNQTGVGGNGGYSGGQQGRGGGIYSTNLVEVTNTTFMQNNSGLGGGVENFGGTAMLSWNTFDGNTAGSGGGLSNYAGGTFQLTNSTVANNQASDEGGGIYNDGTMIVTFSTLSNNGAPSGGGLYQDAGTFTLRNSIIAHTSMGANCNVNITDGGYNIEDKDDCGLSAANHSQSDTDPNLDPSGLQANGGLTKTIALQGTSPAVDAIPPGTNDCGTTVTTDQRGVPRPQDPQCDVGAYELTPASPAPALSPLALGGLAIALVAAGALRVRRRAG